jgi:hypothetical protein
MERSGSNLVEGIPDGHLVPNVHRPVMRSKGAYTIILLYNFIGENVCK